MTRYWLLTSGFLLLLTFCVVADDRPASLTPQEISDGWLNLFDGESTFGWKIDSAAKVENGELIFGGEKPADAVFPIPIGPSRMIGVMRLVGGSEFTLDRESPSGHYSFHSDAGKRMGIKSMKVKPLKLESIFNGKDLSGWRVFPGRKTEFSVTPEGWLHLKNGPGDLQTEAQWANFVLQVECKTNGDRLNSGVFFRCRPNEYQNGYEAQIHNGFNANADKEYTLDDYDPMTHKLIGKRKEKYAAIDYGTGAIYRRQPAHKSVAKDREWFTMTVVAQGRQMAVWVNGVLVTSWTDNRPDNDNARNGYRAAKGPISLQGHDPTTDLYFRNIRIAELP